jgi:hypothetical protein
MPFDLAAFPGYEPKRTAAPLEHIELKRPITFVFRPCYPVRL